MPAITELRGAHAGRPAAILGGGPSLPDDVARLPRDAVMISVNQHGVLLAPCDYIIYLDERVGNLLPPGAAGVRVSPHGDVADYSTQGLWDNGFTASAAAALALLLGCRPVILCGMDLYQGATYWHDRAAPSPGRQMGLVNQLQAWRVALDRLPGSEWLRAMSGPLVSVFGQYEKGEYMAMTTEVMRFVDESKPKAGVMRLRALADFFVMGTFVGTGTEVVVAERDGRQLVGRGKAVQVIPGAGPEPVEPAPKPRKRRAAGE